MIVVSEIVQLMCSGTTFPGVVCPDTMCPSTMCPRIIIIELYG